MSNLLHHIPVRFGYPANGNGEAIIMFIYTDTMHAPVMHRYGYLATGAKLPAVLFGNAAIGGDLSSSVLKSGTFEVAVAVNKF
jgi:hypothetical protein